MSQAVMLIDRHEVMRAGFRSVIENCEGLRLVGEADEVGSCLAQLYRRQPDIVVIGVDHPDERGLELLCQIREEQSFPRILVIAHEREGDAVLGILRKGVDGYLLRESRRAEMETALIAVASGYRYLSPPVTADVIRQALAARGAETSGSDVGLTPRQHEVLGLIARGLCTKQIAYELGVSVKTIESHRAGIMSRLNIRELPRLVLFALQQGFGAERR